MVNETVRRAERLCAMMDESIWRRSAAERDRLLQQFIAAAKTPSERFRTLGVLMNFAISRNCAMREEQDG